MGGWGGGLVRSSPWRRGAGGGEEGDGVAESGEQRGCAAGWCEEGFRQHAGACKGRVYMVSAGRVWLGVTVNSVYVACLIWDGVASSGDVGCVGGRGKG